jgi:hypothetical protein
MAGDAPSDTRRPPVSAKITRPRSGLDLLAASTSISLMRHPQLDGLAEERLSIIISIT